MLVTQLVVFDKDGQDTYTKSFTAQKPCFSTESVGFIRFIGQNGTNIRLDFIDLNYTELVQGKPVFI